MDDTCSRCGRGVDTDGKLWYSIVCVHALCDRCKREAFARHRTVVCGARNVLDGRSSSSSSSSNSSVCDASIVAGELSRDNADTREFAAEKIVRRNFAAVYNATRSDFASISEWDTYAERCEILIAALVSGTASEKAAAKAEVEAHRTIASADIEAAASRRTAEATAAGKAKEAEEIALNVAARTDNEREEKSARESATVRSFLRAVNLGEARVTAAATGGPLTTCGPPPASGVGGASSTVFVDEAIALEKSRERLISLIGARRAAKETAAAQAASRDRNAFIPILPYTSLPRVYGYLHPTWSDLSTPSLPRESLRAHWRAAGLDSSAAKCAAETEFNEMMAF